MNRPVWTETFEFDLGMVSSTTLAMVTAWGEEQLEAVLIKIRWL
jgi:hypothetical protein